jgi:PhnB protein
MKAATYLEFKHNAKEAIETYKAIFDAQVTFEYFYDANMTKDPEMVGKVYHAEMKIGDLNLYVSDSGIEPSFTSMRFVVEIHEESKAREVFGKLAQGGKIVSDFQKIPIGPTIAHVVDRFYIHWNIVIC